MKKKLIAIIGMCAAFVLGLAACGGNPDQGGTVYDTLNRLVAKEAETVTLTVSSTLNGETLTGSYEAKTEGDKVKVTYSFEQMNVIEKDADGNYIVPDTAKSTKEGSMVVSHGKVIEQNGAAADLTIEAVTAAGITFHEEYFSDISIKEGEFSAAVGSPAAFLGQQITCTAMRVKVAYTENAISSIELSYTASGGAQIAYRYAFA